MFVITYATFEPHVPVCQHARPHTPTNINLITPLREFQTFHTCYFEMTLQNVDDGDFSKLIRKYYPLPKCISKGVFVMEQELTTEQTCKLHYPAYYGTDLLTTMSCVLRRRSAK